jgi:pimeloyl-ACP methyl ester carboxylesterase
VGLHILHWGKDGDPILILLHGGGANSHWWDHIAAPLADDHHVIALDFRGHGDSDYPEELVVGAFNDDLEALCEHLETRNVTLIGASMGAHVALDHASRHPETRAAVLIDLARGGTSRSKRVARLALSLRRSYATRDEAIDRYRFIPAAHHADESLRRDIARRSIMTEPDGRFGFKFDPRWFGVSSRPRPDSSQVACPTLIVRGGESTLMTHDGATSLVSELSCGQLLEVSNAGHHVQLDRPAELLAGIRTFLEEVE